METLASKLKYLRIKNEMSIPELAKQSGFTFYYIISVESGRTIPLHNYLTTMSKIFCTSYDQLFRLAVVSKMDRLAAFLGDGKWNMFREVLIK